jgi:hypothetical protein
VGDDWENDISCKVTSPVGRKSTPLFLGDVDNTFVWKKPIIKFKEDRGSGNKEIMMKQLLLSDDY